MANREIVTVEISKDVDEKPDALARATGVSKAAIANEAINSFVDENLWQIEEIKQAVRDADRPDCLWVAHDEVMDWFESLGTDNPLPRPQGRRRSEFKPAAEIRWRQAALDH